LFRIHIILITNKIGQRTPFVVYSLKIASRWAEEMGLVLMVGSNNLELAKRS